MTQHILGKGTHYGIEIDVTSFHNLGSVISGTRVTITVGAAGDVENNLFMIYHSESMNNTLLDSGYKYVDVPLF
jgi:hypothetical protein